MTTKKLQSGSKPARKTPDKTTGKTPAKAPGKPRKAQGKAKQKTPTAPVKFPFAKPQVRMNTGKAAREAQQKEAQRPLTVWGVVVRLLPVWALLVMVLILEPSLPMQAISGLAEAVGLTGRGPLIIVEPRSAEPVFIVEGAQEAPALADHPTPNWDLTIAPIFTPEVHYWADEIAVWSLEYRIQPNLIATLVQIESCGNPTAASSAGALGLFQVMPLHFAQGEDPFDPQTNARRGLTFFAEMYAQANGDLGLAFAAYNGGPGVLRLSPTDWPAETQSYQFWGSGIFEEAEMNLRESPTLLSWLNSGGATLCSQASQALGLSLAP